MIVLQLCIIFIETVVYIVMIKRKFWVELYTYNAWRVCQLRGKYTSWNALGILTTQNEKFPARHVITIQY